MSKDALRPSRRLLLAASIAGCAATATPPCVALAATGPDETAIKPFRAAIAQEAVDDLRRRVRATRWPPRETVTDQSQGVPLAAMQELVRYWGDGYDWRRGEAQLNRHPQFMTRIDGLDIHFIHVRSRHPHALPLIVTHGWPGSVFEQLKIIEPLTDPTAHGGEAPDAFHLVIPSVPGYGFSQPPTEVGWGPDRIARAWAELMPRLGYERYVAQGGDWGSPVTAAMARQAARGLVGIHLNLPAAVPPEIAAALAAGGPAPAGLGDKERAAYEALNAAGKMGNRSYAVIMGARPQTIGYAVTDSPAGLAAWLLGHPGFSRWIADEQARSSPTMDEVLDDISLYWLTNSAASAGRIYWEYGGGRSPVFAAPEKTSEIGLPVAITVFPGETYQAPETWARRAYSNLAYFHEVDRGGHFAAWEEPELFSQELRAAFRPLRKAG
jgi:pimeloyl-ACP methyl ester carboxylesterase